MLALNVYFVLKEKKQMHLNEDLHIKPTFPVKT